MTIVYRWSEIVKGRYASPESLRKARERAIAIMKKLHKHGLIRGASIFGSVARGDAAIGSDFDALVISKQERQPVVQKYLARVFSSSMRNLRVEPEIIHVSDSEASSGRHSVTPFLISHIRSNTGLGGTVGTDPLKLLKVTDEDWLSLEKNQLLFTENRFRKARMALPSRKETDSDEYYKILDATLNKPVATCRHVLELMGELPTRRGRVDDRKAAVTTKYCELFAQDEELVRSMASIVAASNAYGKSLNSAIDAIESGDKKRLRSARKDYAAALKSISEVIPHAERVIAHNVAVVENLIRAKK